jgi:hypothetical protein
VIQILRINLGLGYDDDHHHLEVMIHKADGGDAMGGDDGEGGSSNSNDDSGGGGGGGGDDIDVDNYLMMLVYACSCLYLSQCFTWLVEESFVLLRI